MLLVAYFQDYSVKREEVGNKVYVKQGHELSPCPCKRGVVEAGEFGRGGLREEELSR